MTNSSVYKRPKHVNKDSLLRAMQMSSIEIFAFVESPKHDPYFYGKLCEISLSSTGLYYKIMTAYDIPNSCEGKTSLLDLFRYLSDRNSLIDNFKGKKTGIIFFLDKDIDDITNKKIESNHVIYTYFYCIENHLIENGDLKEGCAMATAMDPQVVSRSIGNQVAWLHDTAQKWKEWVKICVFAKTILSEKCPYNYDRPSQINNPLTGSVDRSKYDLAIAALKNASGFPEDLFSIEYEKVSNLVDSFYQKGEQGKLFKGNWHEYFLDDHLKRLSEETSGRKPGLGQTIFHCMAGTLDFKAAWARHFIKPIEKIAGMVRENS